VIPYTGLYTQAKSRSNQICAKISKTHILQFSPPDHMVSSDARLLLTSTLSPEGYKSLVIRFFEQIQGAVALFSGRISICDWIVSGHRLMPYRILTGEPAGQHQGGGGVHTDIRTDVRMDVQTYKTYSPIRILEGTGPFGSRCPKKQVSAKLIAASPNDSCGHFDLLLLLLDWSFRVKIFLHILHFFNLQNRGESKILLFWLVQSNQGLSIKIKGRFGKLALFDPDSEFHEAIHGPQQFSRGP
jgi:hypothetical protein